MRGALWFDVGARGKCGTDRGGSDERPAAIVVQREDGIPTAKDLDARQVEFIESQVMSDHVQVMPTTDSGRDTKRARAACRSEGPTGVVRRRGHHR